jgi:hypothetical protein
MPTVILDSETCRYISAFSIAAMAVKAERITA